MSHLSARPHRSESRSCSCSCSRSCSRSCSCSCSRIALAFVLVFRAAIPGVPVAGTNPLVANADVHCVNLGQYPGGSQTLGKNRLRPLGCSRTSSQFWTVVLGGTAALHVLRAWGAVLFWADRMNREPHRRERRFSWPLAFTLFALIAALLVALLFWRLESWPMRTAQQGSAELERLGTKVRDAFVDLAQLQPRVTINNRVYFEKTRGGRYFFGLIA